MRVGQSRRRDYNEQEIIDALERAGITVYRISGEGVPDLLTSYRGVWLPIEVKQPRGHLTPAQKRTAIQTPYPVVETITQALSLFGVQA